MWKIPPQIIKNIMNKFVKFQKAYDTAIDTITSFQQPGNLEPQMNELVNWMLETDANPYAYLPEAWASSTYTAEGFAGLLHHIHYAIYGDGDITFVSVYDEPRIVFANRNDADFIDRVLTLHEKQSLVFSVSREYDIKILDIEPNEFGVLYDQFQKDDIKHRFLDDASRFEDVEWTANNYRIYKCWDESWIEEAKTLALQ